MEHARRSAGGGTSPLPELETLTYIGNRRTKKVHRSGCVAVTVMRRKNKVRFETVDAALEKGYEPCGRCKP